MTAYSFSQIFKLNFSFFLSQNLNLSPDYAMQMELPALGDDENELELSCVVPSAVDMGSDDGNDPDHQNGIRVDNAVLG
jgi:hypothetical protein